MTRNKRLLISSFLLIITAVTLISLNHNVEAVEICDISSEHTITAETNPNDGTAQITNASDRCAYKVGVASFKEAEAPADDSKKLYDVKYGVVKKNDTLALNIEVPDCNSRYEAFVGDIDKHTDINSEAGKPCNDEANTQITEDDPSTIPTITTTPTVTNAPTLTPTTVPSVTSTQVTPTILTPTVTSTPTPPATPITENTSDPTPQPEADQSLAETPTPAIQIINNNNNTNNNHNEQRIIIEENGRTRELVVENGRASWGEVLSVTTKGQPVYRAPQHIATTPGTGPEAIPLLMLVPTGLTGYIIRKKLQ